MQRDATQIGFTDVEATNAWDDDGGYAHYLLGCTPLTATPHERA